MVILLVILLKVTDDIEFQTESVITFLKRVLAVVEI